MKIQPPCLWPISILLLSLMLLPGCTKPPIQPDASLTPSTSLTPASASGEPDILMVPKTLPGTDQIVVYPGATDVESDDENAPLYRSILFTTPDNFDQVYTFYKDTYTAKGWQVNSRRITFMDADFVWADDAGVVPWNEGLGLDVHNQVSGGTRYVVWFSRQADPDNIPVIEGATNVQTAMAPTGLPQLSDLDLGPARVVTYSTPLTPTAILDSYKYHMLTYGWRDRDEGADNVSFVYSYGVPEQMYINIAVITVAATGNGESTVTVAAAGSDTHELTGSYTPPIASVTKMLSAPATAPVYPGATSTYADDPRRWRSRLFGLESMDAWITPDTPEQVKAFYLDSLPKQGWKEVPHGRTGWSRFIYDTGPSCQTRYALYVITAPERDGKTRITVISYLGCYVISGDE